MLAHVESLGDETPKDQLTDLLRDAALDGYSDSLVKLVEKGADIKVMTRYRPRDPAVLGSAAMPLISLALQKVGTAEEKKKICSAIIKYHVLASVDKTNMTDEKSAITTLVNVADSCGNAPLHYAFLPEVYDFLVSLGANENARNNSGHVPKTYQTQHRQRIVENSAAYNRIDQSTNEVDSDGVTPSPCAKPREPLTRKLADKKEREAKRHQK